MNSKCPDILNRATKILLIALFMSQSNAAEVNTSAGNSESAFFFYLDGTIYPGDLRKIASAFEKSRSRIAHPEQEWMEVARIGLNSDGGDVDEAMRIGRWLREHKFGTYVKGKCYSACVYVLASGLTRSVVVPELFEVGIHRPRFSVMPKESIGSAMNRVLAESKKYFEEMNIPASIADDIFSIPPEDLKILDGEELSKFRLDQNDYVYAEKMDFYNAAQYKMTREQYMAAKSRSESIISTVCQQMKSKVGSQEYWNCEKYARESSGLIEK